jgi:hypothetical protein
VADKLAGDLERHVPTSTIQLVGSKAAIMHDSAEHDRLTGQLSRPESDLDIHWIVPDIALGVQYLVSHLSLGFPADLPKRYCADLVATKVIVQNVLVSLHVFDVRVLALLSRLDHSSVAILRDSRGKRTFHLASLKEERSTRLVRTLHAGANPRHWLVEFTSAPIVDGDYYMQPYHSMFLSGLPLGSNDVVASARSGLLRAISSALRGVRGSDIAHLFRTTWSTVPTSLIQEWDRNLALWGLDI